LIFSQILDHSQHTECAWYFINYILDVPLVPLFSYIFLHLVEKALNRVLKTKIISGYYGADPAWVYFNWAIQVFLWLFVVTIVRVFIFICVRPSCAYSYLF